MPRVSITIPGKNSQPYRFKLDRNKVTIGRSADNDIVIDDTSVSSTHCTMDRVDGGYVLRDKNSTNGISLDTDGMEVIDLRNGDDVKVGDVQFEYTLSDDELDSLDDEDFKALEKKKLPKGPPAQPKAQPKVQANPNAPRPLTPQPLASNNSGGGMLSFGTVVIGIVALLAGLNNGYTSKQEKLGRKGEIFLHQDVLNGRPALEEKPEE
ncbi:FHA domain-containing protein [Akkermansiaceae bacterium]|nr:FHA domain-containing protein [Akkermansiaceae bacterium]MDA7917339.1 FHA domain-containing protein [Akkermansiaceae bacterium]MDA8969208.1 FHA domain-containing protein [Akkermansiaceae bacterium]MDB4273016.1 FHA domain-containing protein [Akkermansiaceae bacterium]MDB4506776.1 FHA domain-containing protein [Akkermansiaceae bacterium]